MKKYRRLLLLAAFISAVLLSVFSSRVAVYATEECTEHSFGEYVSNNDATCASDGTKTAVCSVCGKTDTVTDEGTREGHHMESGWEKNKFEHWKKCRDCGNNIEASYGNHIYAVTVIREATVNAEGLERRECTFCHYSYEETVPKLVRQGLPAGAIVAIALVGVTGATLLFYFALRKPTVRKKTRK